MLKRDISLLPAEDQRQFNKQLRFNYWVCWCNPCGGITLGVDIEDRKGYVEDKSLVSMETVFHNRRYIIKEKESDLSLMSELTYECDKAFLHKFEYEKLWRYYNESS